MIFSKAHILYLLLFLPIFILSWLLLDIKAKRKLENLIPKHHWPKLIPGISFTRRRLKFFFFMLAIIFIIISCAQPRFGYKKVEKIRRGNHIMIALDTSKSMLAKDITPNRFQRAKQEIKGLLQTVKGDQVGLLLFAGESFIQCPLTNDYAALSLFLDHSHVNSIPKPGSNLAKAIKKTRLNFKHIKGEKLLILFTDGENFEHDPIASAKIAAKENIKILSVGIGNKDGEPIPIFDTQNNQIGYKKDKNNQIIFSKLNETTLKEIAQITKGQYFNLKDKQSISPQLYRFISQQDKQRLKTTKEEHHIHRYTFFLNLALLFLLLSLIIRETSHYDQ